MQNAALPWRWLLLAAVLAVIGVLQKAMRDGVAQRQALAGLAVEDPAVHHPLTAAERAQFEASGMLVIPAALSVDEVSELNAALEYWSSETTGGVGVLPGTTWHGMTFSSRHDAPSRHPALVSMLAHPRILPKVVGILGWNIYIYHAHAAYTRAATDGAGLAPKPSGDHWHQDSGRVNVDVEGEPRPRLSVKASIMLTDTTDPAAPQFYVVPGSHLNNTMPHTQPNSTELPPGAVRVPLQAGSVVLIDRRLWHAGPLGEQKYGITRKVLFNGYGQRWLRPKDPMYTAPVLAHVTCPVLRQLLGHTHTYNGLYSPTTADVPLMSWLDEHGMLKKPAPLAWEDCSQSSKWIGGCE